MEEEKYPEVLTRKTNTEEIHDFISEYSKLFTDDVPETPPPDLDFKHRNITTLFLGEEGVLFDKLLDGKFHEEQIDMLIETMELAEKMKKNILYRKAGAVIAMKLKDKRINEIHNAFA